MTAPLGTAVRDAAREQLRRELAVRLTASHDAVLRRVPDLYRRIIGEALLAEDGQTGKAAQLRTAQRALDRVARIGVVDFTDTSGRRWNMQSYVEMAVRTAALRAMITAQMRVYRERGISLVRVSDHAGGCPLCAPFEGRLLAIDAMPAGPVTDRSGSRVEVVATVAEAIAAGLHHPQCRHRTSAFIPGVTVMPPPQPHDPTEYADQQRLRALERAVRFWRRREAAAITPEARETARRKVAEWQGAIRAHVAATGTRRLREREQTVRPLTSPTPRRRDTQPAAVPTTVPDDDRTGYAVLDTTRAEQQTAATRVEDHYGLTAGLTAAEVEAIRMYTHERYSRINASLRRGAPDPRDADIVAGVDTAMGKYTTVEPISVWRGLRTYTPPPNLPAGHILEDDAYASTGMTSEVFSGVQMEITIPAGFHGIAVNGAVPGGLSEAEREFLLPRGTRFAVTSDEQMGGRRWLKVVALPPEV